MAALPSRSTPKRTRVFHTPGGRIMLGGCVCSKADASEAATLSKNESTRRWRYCINYVTEGSGIYRDDRGMSYPIEPGTVFHRLPGRHHRTEIDAAAYEECYFHFTASLYSALRAAGVIVDTPPVRRVADRTRIAEPASRLYEVLAPDWDGEWAEVVSRVVAFMAAVAGGPATGEAVPEWIGEARAFVMHNAGKRMTVAQMASRFDMSPKAFSREFLKHAGCPPGRFLMNCRIDRACSLLQTESVKAAAYRLGYPDPKTFSKQFREYVGMSPSQFQQRELDP